MNEDERIASKRFGNEKLLQKVNMDNIGIKKRLNISQYGPNATSNKSQKK